MTILNRKERDRQLRRSDILKAAEHLFAIKGYNKATIRDIAKEAQYATGTVYLHFKDKEALFFALFEEKLKNLLSIIEEKIKQVKDARSKLRIFVREGLDFFAKNSNFFKIFVSESDRLLIEKRILKSPAGQQFQDYTVRLIRQAQEQRVISSELAARQAADVFFAILKIVGIECFKEKNGKLPDLSDLILRYFLYGTANK
ncbi:MAG: TetR/AcrR family transcriptional regulator [Candidatus Omnitrophota bacterium]